MVLYLLFCQKVCWSFVEAVAAAAVGVAPAAVSDVLALVVVVALVVVFVLAVVEVEVEVVLLCEVEVGGQLEQVHLVLDWWHAELSVYDSPTLVKSGNVCDNKCRKT